MLPQVLPRSSVPASNVAAKEYISMSGNPMEEIHLRDLWAVVVRRRRLVLVILMVALGIGFYVTMSATSLYTASATIKIEPQNPVVTGVTDILPSQSASASPYDYYQTQFALLKSRTLADKVINDLKLESKPVFTEARVISSNVITRIRSSASGFLQFCANYLPSKVKPDLPANRDPNLDTNQVPRESDVQLQVIPGLVGRYLRFLEILPVKNTRLVEVGFTTPDPELSQQLANAHATAFIRLNLDSRFELSNEARDFLDTKNAELKDKLESAEAALNQFRQAHGVVSLEKGENVVVERLLELNRALTGAKAQRIEAESLYRTVQSKDSQYLSQVMKEGLVPMLKASLATLEAERSSRSTTFKPAHPGMAALSHQISETRRSIDREIANVVRGIEENYTAALAKEKALQAETDKQQQKALNLKHVGVQYAVLEEEVKVNRRLYESVLNRLNETNVANDLAVSNIRIVERADKPLSASSPDTIVNLLLSIGVGLFLGVGLVFGLEYFDSTVDTPQNVSRVVGLSTLGVVPDLKSIKRPLLGWSRASQLFIEGPAWLRLLAPDSSASKLDVTDQPPSILAESYRTIRTALLFSQAEKPPQIVLVTSPSPDEGKTVTTLNLAVTLAQHNNRVLIIDADLRKGCCHTRLKMKNDRGLSNVLTGNLSLEEAIQTAPVKGVFLLSGGVRPPNPSDLLGSPKMREVLNHLRQSFNFILIDSPPAIALTDAAVLSMVSDGVILVFNGKRTTMASARQVVEALDTVRAPILGVVLNAVDLQHPSYASYRHYYGSDYYAPKAAESKNCNEIGIDGVNNDEVSGTENWPSDLKSGTVPPESFDRIATKLTEVVGPMAPVILNLQIAFLGESLESFPKRRLKELVELVCIEIPNEQKKESFREAISSEVRFL